MAFSRREDFATVAAMEAISTIRLLLRGRVALALTLGVAVAFALGPTAASTASSDVAVSIVARAYQPPTLTIAAGQTVTWTNHGLTPHTVTAAGGQFDSGRIDAGGSFSVSFATPGTFAYACTIHPSMHGKIVVLAALLPGAQPGAPLGTLHVSLSHKQGSHGKLTLVHVQASLRGAKALLQLQSPSGSSWTTTRRAQLSSAGTVTFTLSASVHRRLRVLVQGPAGEPPLIGKALRPAASS